MMHLTGQQPTIDRPGVVRNHNAHLEWCRVGYPSGYLWAPGSVGDTIVFLGLPTGVQISESACSFFWWEDYISIQKENDVRNFNSKHWDQAKKDTAKQRVRGHLGGQGRNYQTVEALRHLPLTIPKWSKEGEREGALRLNTDNFLNAIKAVTCVSQKDL